MKCPECGHKFTPPAEAAARSNAVKLRSRLLAVNTTAFIAGATIPYAVSVLFDTSMDASHWGAYTLLSVGVANVYAYVDVIGGVRRAMGKRDPIRFGNPNRTADVFNSATKIAGKIMGAKEKPAPVSVVAERVIFGTFTDRDLYRFFKRAERVGLGRRYHSPKHIGRTDYDLLMAWLVNIGLVIGRGGNNSGRLIDGGNPGRLMIRIYQNV